MLPIEWIDKLFTKLALIYGVDVIAKRHSGLDPASVKQEWATCLGGFKHRPEAIRFALDHLPSDRCPTMLQFRDICRQCPPSNVVALPEPKADAVVVDAQMKQILREAFDTGDPKAWAKKLKCRHDAGEKLSIVQVKAYREALNETQ